MSYFELYFGFPMGYELCIGTRPEAMIKLTALIKEPRNHPDKFKTAVTAVGYAGLFFN